MILVIPYEWADAPSANITHHITSLWGCRCFPVSFQNMNPIFSSCFSKVFSKLSPLKIKNKFRCFHLCSFATQKIETYTRKYSRMIKRAELYQGDWMGHPLQSLIAILKHPPWRPQSNHMAPYILTEVQGSSPAQHFQWAIQSWLRNYPKLNDWEVGPTAHKCPCFSPKKILSA